jgi:hypothetical protein
MKNRTESRIVRKKEGRQEGDKKIRRERTKEDKEGKIGRNQGK